MVLLSMVAIKLEKFTKRPAGQIVKYKLNNNKKKTMQHRKSLWFYVQNFIPGQWIKRNRNNEIFYYRLTLIKN